MYGKLSLVSDQGDQNQNHRETPSHDSRTRTLDLGKAEEPGARKTMQCNLKADDVLANSVTPRTAIPLHL